MPPDRRRVYDVRRALELLADEGSVLELRPSFAPGMVTALARVEGRAVGVIANNPMHLAGAIDAANADKAARFLQLCEAFGLPVLSLCDTPGLHGRARGRGDGAGAPRQPHVRRGGVAHGAVRLRHPAQGLRAGRPGHGGRQSSAGPLFTVAWPTGELGGMGLEGAVRLGFRRELDAIDDPDEREAAFDAMVARAYEHGKALHVAEHFEIDDVIDPADDPARASCTRSSRRRRRGEASGRTARPSWTRGDDERRVDDESRRRSSACVGAMTLDEKCSLTAGASLWYLPPVERLGLPALKVSDGPSGVRGDSLDRPALAVAALRHGRRLDVEPRPRRQLGRRAGRRGPLQGRPRAARPDGLHRAHAAGRPHLRVLLRGPAAHGPPAGRLRARACRPAGWPAASSTSPATTRSTSG